MKTRLFDFSYSVPARSPRFPWTLALWARRPWRARQLAVGRGANFHGGWGTKNEGESPVSKRGVTELVSELLSHSNQYPQWHVQPLCSQTGPVTHPSGTSNASTDPLFRHPPTVGSLLTGEMRMVSIFVEITSIHVSCL